MYEIHYTNVWNTLIINIIYKFIDMKLWELLTYKQWSLKYGVLKSIHNKNNNHSQPPIIFN